MSALRGLPKSPILRTRYRILPSTPICIRQIHLAINAPPSLLPIPTFPPYLRFTIPSITTLIPIITGIWDSILRAVPKKKTTHSQKRKRQLVGKGLEDKTNLTRCEACGDWKLLHTLCGSCVKSIQRDWRRREQHGKL
jgi:ribosomal protein L32